MPAWGVKFERMVQKMKRRKASRFLSSGLALAMSLGLVLSTTAQASASDILISDAVNMGAVITDQSATGVTIKSTWEGFNPIIVRDSEYTVDGANISIDSDGDGSVACDFSGYGAAIAAYGDSKLTIENSNVDVSGVGNLALFADDGADVIIQNSTFHSDGGTLYEGYRNSPDQATMVAPPWILGIMGTSRTTNLMGEKSSTTVIDSDMSSSQWAILSTDSGSDMALNVVNTDMTLTGADYALQADGTFDATNPYTSRSGYGTYTIGQANEKFYGVDMLVGTYANILTGGYATYTAMEAGQPIQLTNVEGEVLTTYTPTETKNTTINSDTFGFMIHQNSGLPANVLTLEKGTEVNSGYTSILHKTGSSVVANITSGTQLNPGNGILIQAMDNDDTTTGMDVSTFSFYTTHEENAGWPTVGATAAGTETGTYNLSDVDLEGDIFNATGWASNSYGAQSPIAMSINLQDGATLKGQISSTAAIHVTKEGSDAVANAPSGQKASEDWLQYQNTSFPIGHYFDIGQVANTIQSNTFNTIDVNVESGSVWNVTGNGILNNVTADSDGIVAEAPVTLSVAGTLTLDGQVIDLTPVEAVEMMDDEATEPAEGETTEPTEGETADTAEGETTEPTEGETTEPTEGETTEPTEGETTEPAEGETTDTTTEMESVQLTVASANGPAPLAAVGCNIDTDNDGILDAYQASGSNVIYTMDTSVATQPTDPGEGGGDGGAGGPGGPGGPGGGPGGPGGDTGDQTWYTENDKLTLAVLNGVVVAPGTEGATEYTVDRLMYGTADNLSSFAGGGHDPAGDDDYAFITALYVKDGAVQKLTATPVSDSQNPDQGEDQKPGTDTDTGDNQKPDQGQDQNTGNNNQSTTDTGKNPTNNQNSTSTTAPKTGDMALPFVVGGVGVVALAALVVLLVMHKRRTGRQ